MQKLRKSADIQGSWNVSRQMPDADHWIRVESFACVVDVTAFLISAVNATQIDR